MENRCGIDLMDAIMNRFSVRTYTAEPVTDAQLEALLTAAFCAPSACNRRPWEIIVVRDRAMLDELALLAPAKHMLAQAPLGLVVCGELARTLNRDLLLNDCSAATQNILLAAYGLGLGSCWCGLSDPTVVEKLSGLLSIPEGIIPATLIAVGHPNEQRTQPDRLAPGHVHYEQYGSKA